jgi:hypothetical protein
MTMYIVDCRYPLTTTPVGIPDFTLEVEASSPQHAIQVAEQIDAGDDFVAVGACDTLALVDMLRSHVRILAEFGLEMARKSREAGTDVAQFEALVCSNDIAMPDSEHDDQEDEDEDEEDEDEAAITAERRAIEAEELEAKYGDREHPDYPEHMWRDDDTSRLDYWEWVAERLAAVDQDWKKIDAHTALPHS